MNFNRYFILVSNSFIYFLNFGYFLDNIGLLDVKYVAAQQVTTLPEPCEKCLKVKYF